MLGNSNNSLNTLQSILWNIKWVEKIPYETLGYIWELFLKVHTIEILKARNYESNFSLDIGETIPGNSHLGQIPTLAYPSKVNNLRNRGSSYYSFFLSKYSRLHTVLVGMQLLDMSCTCLCLCHYLPHLLNCQRMTGPADWALMLWKLTSLGKISFTRSHI